jgi:hypothetical protein
MGQVVFFRPAKYVGWILSFTVHEGNKGLGKLGNGTYFIWAATPGTHTYTVESEAKDSLTLEIEPGETYYVMETLGMGLVMARPHLSPSDQTAFGHGLKLSTAKATDIAGPDTPAPTAKGPS